ncbi:CoA transferase family III [Prauserella shujinwangii]|uniref:CoA transferase family III n=1 Tax=Prauserella shujinwangii TaxID=1453103 RepID=A0A2T0M3L4_9PSEU|nr:CoA transferase [Prauserella shujinwangii]PRX51320.1 CoA transferase family III [Prauserella shujinwangii]
MTVASRLWTALTGGPAPPVEVTGAETVLPGPYRVAAAAAAAIGVTTYAAGELLRLRGIDPGRVAVDTRHAAAAFRSEHHVLVDGAVPGEAWAPLSDVYRAADGWVRLHCNYSHHAAAACRALGVPEERDALAAAVRDRAAEDVQEAVVAAGGAAAALRSRAAWRAHPQGAAVRTLPPVRFDPLGGTPPEPLPSGDRPLNGVRVLDLTHVIAGPVAGRTLAAHGADVLRIGAARLPALPLLDADTGLGKRSAHLDLRTDEGRAALWRLVREADVLIQSYRPGALAAWGFGPRQLAEARPGLVVVDISAYGWTGPWAERRGFDSLVQLASGLAHDPGSARPRPLPAQALDHATGWLAATAAMLGLRRRAMTGGGTHARLALAGTAEWLDSLGRLDGDGAYPDVSDLLVRTPGPLGTVTHVAPPGVLPAAPPRWLRGSPVPGADPAAWPRE